MEEERIMLMCVFNKPFHRFDDVRARRVHAGILGVISEEKDVLLRKFVLLYVNSFVNCRFNDSCDRNDTNDGGTSTCYGHRLYNHSVDAMSRYN